LKESKIDISNRLRREGRWGEASLWKDNKIKELRAGGMKRPEAQDAAWEAVEEAYPPIEIPEPEDDESAEVFSAEELVNLPPGTLGEFVADAEWVYANLSVAHANIEAAPSTGAVGLLGWARANQNDFYGKVLARALQLRLEQPDPKQAEKENLAHAKSLQERIGHLVDRQ